MIIGISGFISCGKSTVANRLIEKYNFKKESFATNLKDSVAMIFDWPRNLLEGDTLESRTWRETVDPWWANKLNISDFSPRRAMQLVGTNVLRNHFNSDIWFLTFENRLRKSTDQNSVISDVRFLNEVKFIQEQNGILIKVIRGPEPDWMNMAKDALNGNEDSLHTMKTKYSYVHESEWEWVESKYDFTILNNGTIEDLEIQVDEIANKILT